MISYILCFFIGIIWARLINQQNQSVISNIDRLKNALLSLALQRLRKDDISDELAYDTFDGSKLPLFSGYDIENACFTYIRDMNEMRDNVFHTQSMDNKQKAIRLYLDTHLGTKDQIIHFFREVVDHID